MADILCFYSFPENKNETGYFVIEHNVTYDQLVEFVKNNGLIDETYQIFSQNNEEIDEQKFKQILEDSKRSNEPTISLLFKKEAPLYPSLVPEPQVPEPEPEAEDSPIGPTIRQIMAKIGMKFDEDVHMEDIQECLNSIPMPYCFFVKGFLSQVRSNPSNLKKLVEQAATLFAVDNEALLKEAEVALYFLETGKLPESSKKQAPVAKEEEKPKKAPKPFIGPIIGSVLNHFGVNYSSLNSPENVTQIIDLLPIPLNFVVKSALQQVNQNPLFLQVAVKEIAQKFDFDEDELQGEVTHIFNCLNGQAAEEEEEEVEEAVKEPEVVVKEVHYHSAICDNCSNAIAGARYLCLHCKTYDLCSACEKLNNEAPFHDESHVFAKIKDAKAPYHPEQVLPFINAEQNVNNNQAEPACRRGFGAAQSRMDELETQISTLKSLLAKLQEN